MVSEVSGDRGARVRRRRADAERSIAAILDAAVRVLGERPEASIEDVAAAAGVTRQTVYAHFTSRHALLEAVMDHLGELAAELVGGPEVDELAPVDALRRFLAASWDLLERYPVLLHLGAEPTTPEAEYESHRPIVDWLERLARRGQRSGDFGREVPVEWLATATIALGHAAGEEVRAGRLPADRAGQVFQRSVLRLYGVGEGSRHA